MSNPLRTAAARRAASLLREGEVSPRAQFAGAIANRLTADWVLAGTASAEAEIRQNLPALKRRSRELARNNAYARRYLTIKGDNVLGEEGILLRAMVRDSGGRIDKETNRAIESAWKKWGEVGVCTADGGDAWQDVERLAVESEAMDGDGFVRLLPAWKGNGFGLALQTIDSDQLEVDYDREAGRTARGKRINEIRGSIEIDEWGRPIAYHVWPNHPGEARAIGPSDRIIVPASDMVHLWHRHRVGASRGIPDFAPILISLHMLGRLEEAEIVASRIAAAKGGFFEREPAAIGNIDSRKSEPERFNFEAEPGLFEALPPGWKFQAWSPEHPNTAFSEFRKAIVRSIASGLNVSYNLLASDLEGVNFSSIRSGLLAERDGWRVHQSFTYRHLHRKVYRAWLRWALTTGALPLSSKSTESYLEALWGPRGWPWVDPLKDAQSAALRFRLGLGSRTRECANLGLDFEDVLEELAYEKKLAEDLGVDLSNDTSVSGAGQEREGDEGDEEKESGARVSRFDATVRQGGRARTGEERFLLQTGNGNGRGHE